MKRSLAPIIAASLATAFAVPSVEGLTVNFIVDTPDALFFEMEKLGPTIGDQIIDSPSGAWGLYTFVHQFNPPDEFAEIGLFVKKLLPVSEVIGTDVIAPQIYGLPDFPLFEMGVSEFGDVYVATFELKPGSGDNAQDWDWKMTLTANEAPGGEGEFVPDAGSTLLMLSGAFALMALARRKRAAPEEPIDSESN